MNIIKYLPQSMRDIYKSWKRIRPLASRVCPVCEYAGFFRSTGRPPRLDACCPSCGSLERHRLFWLWYMDHPTEIQSPILHFAAEPVFEPRFRSRFSSDPTSYRTADLLTHADLKINIEQIDLPSGSVATVICNHVLEHVDDRKALAEIYRILHTHGIAILSVPIVEGWAQTYENICITDPVTRELHFGQSDHLRYYGRDFRNRVQQAGFVFNEVTSSPTDVVKFGLLRGESFFVCRKATHAIQEVVT